MKQKDVLLARYLSDSERYADLWNAFLGTKFISSKELEILEPKGIQKNNSQVQMKRVEHDLLKKYRKDGCMCILGVENQEIIDYRMVIRSIGYGLEACQRQLNEIAAKHMEKKDCKKDAYISKMKKEDRLFPVAILVVYFGKDSWDGVTELHHLFGMKNYPEELEKIIPDYKLNLLDIQRFPYMERFQTDLYLVFGFLRRRWDKRLLRRFIKENEERFHSMKEDAYDVIQAYGQFPGMKERKEEYRNAKGEYDMCLAWDGIMEEERLKGRKQGRIEGQKDGEEKMAKLISMLMSENRQSDVMKVVKNRTYRRKLYKEYEIL